MTIVTGLGAGTRAGSILKQRVQQAKGEIVKALILYRLGPNDDDNYENGEQNRALAVEIATRAARELFL